MPRAPQKEDELLSLFDEGEVLTLESIARRFNVTSRHARRLVRKLRTRGFHVAEARQGRYKVFFVPEEHRRATVREVAFTEEETLALAVAAEAARAVLFVTPLGAPLQRAFDKLLGELAPHIYTFDLEEQPSRWHFGPAGISPIDATVFRTLNQAIEEHRTVRIDYLTARSNTFTKGRMINPLLIGMPGGSWVVVAWCHRRRKILDFALAGISHVEWTGSYFSPPANFDRERTFRKRFGALDGEVMTVRLLAEPDRAPYFARKIYHPTQKVIPGEGGRVEVTFEVAGFDAVRAFCQSWGVGITVLDPPELAARLAEEARVLEERYNKAGNKFASGSHPHTG